MTSSASSTKGLFAGGYTSSNQRTNVIEQITIATTANATDFGDLTAEKNNFFIGMVSSSHGGLS